MYLTLRRIPYAQCDQPPMLPRPDLESIGVAYRRIPILAHGRSVYCDTQLIIAHLESAFPSSDFFPTSPEHKALQKLLGSWTIDGGIFARAAQALPPDLPLMKDPKFVKDREQYTGRSWSEGNVRALRPEALVHLREAFEFLETGLLSDGRDWILNTEGPQLADIEAIWPFAWLLGLKVALPKDLFSPTTFPKVFDWVERFNKAVEKAKRETHVKKLTGEEAANVIMNAKPVSNEAEEVDSTDPTGLKEGDLVESWPSDTGFKNRDRGHLVRLNRKECVLENHKGVLIHHPRWNFRLRGVTAKTKEIPKI